MASAETTHVFNCTIDEFFKLIEDFESYPQFLSEVKQCKVLKTEGNAKLVEFHVSVIKSITYRLWITLEKPHKMHWKLESGDMFKTSDGGWDLTEKNGQTHARYWVDATFKIFVPGPIAKGLVSVNLPNMMAAYTQRVKEVYGK